MTNHLAKENQRLRNALKRYIQECPSCNGTGMVENFVAHHGIYTSPDEECMECKWAREALGYGLEEASQ